MANGSVSRQPKLPESSPSFSRLARQAHLTSLPEDHVGIGIRMPWNSGSSRNSRGSDTTTSYLAASHKGGLTKALTQQKKTIASGLSEAEAIDRAKRGDAESFEGLYGLHKRRVYSLCLRMTGNTAEAEDLTQEAFLQLYRKIATFRGESAFSTWLHRMAVNVVLMQLRKKSLPLVPLEDTIETEEEAPKKEPGAEDPVLAGSVDRLELKKAVDSLPPGYRTIFVLHDVEGYEHN